MYVSKVRLTQSRVLIEYRTPTGEAHALECADRPLPSFVAAVHALVPLVLSICELPKDYAEKLTPTGLTLTEKQDAKLVCITAKKDLMECHSPLNLATPLRFMTHPEKEGSFSPPLSDKDVALVEEVLQEAKRYVKGERAQGQLPFEGAVGEDPDEGEGKEENATPPLQFTGGANENGTPQTAPASEPPARPKGKRKRKAS